MIELLALDPETAELRRGELPLEGVARCGLRLRCLPGAEAIHLALVEAETVRLRAEVPAEGGEVVLLAVERGEGGGLTLVCPERKVLGLAAEAGYRPAPVLRPAPDGAPLDLALVVDGTLQVNEGASLAEPLAQLVAALVEAVPAPRLALIAFGDEAPPEARADDLLPRYRLFPAPAERRFRALEAEALRAALLAISPTSGGDFVDALADALAACTELHWRPEARRLVVVVGDSPGYSIVRPAPAGADAGVREHDVEGAALDLHERGVEIVTLYQPPAGARLERERELLDFAREQYRRLASCPDLAFSTEGFEPIAVAEAIRAHRGPFGRAASWGELIAIDAGGAR